jgi:xylan 1,4-beta-xylosidase
MKGKTWAWLAALLALSSCAAFEAPRLEPIAEPPAGEAAFDWFEYRGQDRLYDRLNPGPNEYVNPILAGFYPDPAITQNGDDYYLVTSSFTYFPGLPIFHSRDLVSWTQIGAAIDRPGMLDFKNLGVSRGVFAPAIAVHDGVFYIANTCVDCGGNYIITARDPAGPWSDPVWLPQVGGIDPSLFFDDDGTVYLMNNDDPPEPPRYSGHRAIWIRAIDPHTFQSIAQPTVLVDGGVRPEEKPIWIEGPHIYKHEGFYYLSAAEGGTAMGHSQVVLRSRNVLGPYEAYPGNPILTQRQLDASRPDPITSVGHASYVTTPDGQWWATFLGVRPYEGDFYNTGRETFLMPVRWIDGWPVMTQGDELVPYMHARPALAAQPEPAIPTHGNFTLRDDFDGATLAPYWEMIRAPGRSWQSFSGGALSLRARPDSIGGFAHPSFVGRRQQHQFASASTSMHFEPASPGDEAGLVAFQNDEFYYFIGVADVDGNSVVQLKKRDGAADPADGVVMASAPLNVTPGAPVFLRIDARGGLYDFYYATKHNEWTPLYEGADGKVLSTRTAGGFVGAMFGLYAHAPGAAP